MSKRIAVLGSTGSIGRQTLQVVDENPGDYTVTALAAGSNLGLLAEQVARYGPRYVSVGTPQAAGQLKSMISGLDTEITYGREGLAKLAGLNETDLVLVAVTGINGLWPTLTALENKKTVALANKETLVTAGSLVMSKAGEKGARLIPVDSEHSAIFQCLEEHNKSALEKLILTASGGPFLHHSPEQLAAVTPEQALRHPKWQMGVKITIDSAGMINKGLEIMEAHWLFAVPYEKIEVVIHPQSVIHSMVEYGDGAVLAQLGRPDMRVPIQYALTYPARRRNNFPRLDFPEIGQLTFLKPDYERFPGLRLAYEAGKAGGTMPTVYNAANEVAVDLFLEGKVKFTQIPVIIEKVMTLHSPGPIFEIGDILAADSWARVKAADCAG